MKRLMEILAFFKQEFPEDHPYQAIKPSPDPSLTPWVRWMTGEYKAAPPTLEEARAHTYTEQEKEAREQNKNKFVIGSVEHVKQQLEEIAAETGVDEIMIANMITDKDARHKSYSLLAEAFSLSGESGASI